MLGVGCNLLTEKLVCLRSSISENSEAGPPGMEGRRADSQGGAGVVD